MPPLLLAIAAWESAWWAAQKVERRTAYAAALAEARSRGKSLLIVGASDGEYGCGDAARGDVVLDLRPDRRCPNHIVGNVEDLSRWRAGTFGAALISFTLEHTCDPARAWAELHRVADRVFLVTPHPWRRSGRLLPGRRWTVYKQGNGGGVRLVPMDGKRCNVASRYGARALAGLPPMVGRP